MVGVGSSPVPRFATWPTTPSRPAGRLASLVGQAVPPATSPPSTLVSQRESDRLNRGYVAGNEDGEARSGMASWHSGSAVMGRALVPLPGPHELVDETVVPTSGSGPLSSLVDGGGVRADGRSRGVWCDFAAPR